MVYRKSGVVSQSHKVPVCRKFDCGGPANLHVRCIRFNKWRMLYVKIGISKNDRPSCQSRA
jgi:hypothetical protein